MEYYAQVLDLTARALAPKSGLEQLPRRERERQIRCKDILEAGRHLFARKGYHLTTLDDVAEAVELGKATLYSYFDSKERLFESVLEDSFATMKAIGETALASPGTFEERIRMFIAAEMDFFFRNPSSLRLMMREAHQLRGRNPMLHLMPQLFGIMGDAIARAQAAGEVFGDADPVDLAVMLFNMMNGQMMARVYRCIIDDANRGQRCVSDEQLAEALKKMDSAMIEQSVTSVTDVIFKVYFAGIRSVQ